MKIGGDDLQAVCLEIIQVEMTKPFYIWQHQFLDIGHDPSLYFLLILFHAPKENAQGRVGFLDFMGLGGQLLLCLPAIGDVVVDNLKLFLTIPQYFFAIWEILPV